ncbi:unnamed protein product, partial [Sphacelaria rigidula]
MADSLQFGLACKGSTNLSSANLRVPEMMSLSSRPLVIHGDPQIRFCKFVDNQWHCYPSYLAPFLLCTPLDIRYPPLLPPLALKHTHTHTTDVLTRRVSCLPTPS